MTSTSSEKKQSLGQRCLNQIETLGNLLPDPVLLFLGGLCLVWGLSWLLAPVPFSEIDPRTGNALQIKNLLTASELTHFLSNIVPSFVTFFPLGVVLVAMLGVGVAEHSGYINTALKLLLQLTPRKLLTPMLVLVGVTSSVAVDVGYVLVIPIGGLIFHTAGRHPLAGIAAAFAGVSGGFGANFIPSGVDPLLQGFTQSAAQILDPTLEINPLCNYYFTSASSLLIMIVGWYVTDFIVEPRLKNLSIDPDVELPEDLGTISPQEKKAFWIATSITLLGFMGLALALAPESSPFRDVHGNLTSFSSPIMKSIVPLIFLFFVIPGTIYGYVAGAFNSSKEVVQAMAKSMDSMGYYIVMIFFCALFVKAFGASNIGALLAVKGAAVLQAMALPGEATIVGIIFLAALVNVFVGSASAKWALISPIFVPMLMQVNLSPELTQAAFRIGDSSSNIITPLMPYFPLVLIFAQRYIKNLGMGTLISIMMPYTLVLLFSWSSLLVLYWQLGLPLGLQASYTLH